ncbi:hypothetical protein [Belnapia rosea]|uniref:Uncharacterized protein n=1 Tax=Belnapia rosea TaxID=938405 RepID=A0A1G6SM80_9PROT|nr:hypothetical protein [Belnapia rosea]SDB61274.1 hypothetical protein SAMN02927895_02481 [Belnapia rosea]SDD17948.1 hypothetical protein SAMN04487779_100581 [Belnapia rosea]
MAFTRLAAPLLLVALLAACGGPPRPRDGVATPDQNGRMAPTPQTTAPRTMP